ncbi:MAG TPA: hypothetical protein VJQ82_26810, partial [Terriglobales bacterium]|nr:hypothetical protein [Terriglobales bacterium]
NGITTLRSGVPFGPAQHFSGSALSILGGGGGYFGAGGSYDRPDSIAGCDTSAHGSPAYRATHGWFNTACFAPVPSNEVRFGNAPRNVSDIRLDPMDNWDISLSKRNSITESVYLQFTAEFFNAFNHPRFGAPDNFVGDSTFGIVTSQANPARAIQFGLRVGF